MGWEGLLRSDCTQAQANQSSSPLLPTFKVRPCGHVCEGPGHLERGQPVQADEAAAQTVGLSESAAPHSQAGQMGGLGQQCRQKVIQIRGARVVTFGAQVEAGHR